MLRGAAEEDRTLWLPDEVMLMVLIRVVYTGACAQVCRRWRRLVSEPFVKTQRWSLRWGDYAGGRLEPRRLPGPAGAIRSLALSPCGARIYAGDETGTLTVWRKDDAGTHVRATVLSAHELPIVDVAVAKDGTVFTASDDVTVKVWAGGGPDLTLLRTLTGHTNWVTSIAIAPCGIAIFSGSGDRTIRKWDWRTGEQIGVLAGHRASVLALAEGDDARLFSGSGDNTIRAWNMRSGVHLATLEGHEDIVRTLAVGGASLLASGSEDKTIRIWAQRDFTPLSTIPLTEMPTRLMFGTVGSRLFCIGLDDRLRVWPRPLDASVPPVEIHTGEADVCAMALAPDGTLFTEIPFGDIGVW
eukprot:m.454133 g.454133  ORF g.454133 m.454133 type:complete len:356 (+) comp20620_c0_seq1:448-1515(+)